MKLRRDAKRIVLVTRITMWNLPIVAFARLGGCAVYGLALDLPSRFRSYFSQFLVSSTLLESAPIPAGSYDLPSRRFADSVETWFKTPQMKALLDSWPLDDFSRRLLYTAVLRRGAGEADTAFRVLLFAKVFEGARIHIFCSSKWERLVVSSAVGAEFNRQLRVTSFSTTTLRRAVSAILRSFKRMLQDSNAPDVLNGSAFMDREATALLFLNGGMDYGNLYSYDFLLKPFLGSQHRDHVTVFSRSGGSDFPQASHRVWPSQGLSLGERVGVLRKTLTSLAVAQVQIPANVMYEVVRTLFVAQRVSMGFRLDYPKAKVAVFAYENRIPVDFSLALQLTGITSISLHERPSSAVTQSLPIASRVLLTPSVQFSTIVLGEKVHAVERALPIGMWRTDLVREFQSCDQEAQSRPRVLVLTHHALPEGSPHGTSATSVNFFLNEILDLADDIPEVDFLIRSKSLDWMQAPLFAELRKRIIDSPNVFFSDSAAAASLGYRQLASATLVIGRYTSMIDEALALGIPALVHDYSETTSGYSRSVISYLPTEVFVNSYGELLRMSLTMLQPASIDRLTLVNAAQDFLGHCADGRVRERYAETVDHLRTDVG